MAGNRKVVKFHNVPTINIGVIIFGLIFIFLGVQIVRSLNMKRVAVYEVQKSYMDTNISGTAMALRQESLINTDVSGYVNYYIRDGQKVAKNATVYTVDAAGTLSDLVAEAADNGTALDSVGYSDIRDTISAFRNYFNDTNYSDVYEFKYEIEGQVLDIVNNQILDELVSSNSLGGSYTQIPAAESGIVTFYQDGYETRTPADVTMADFDEKAYTHTSLKTGEVIQSGNPVYKLITSDYWNLVLPLSEEDADRLKADTRVTLYLPNVSHVVYGDIAVIQNGDAYFANITLDKLMVNYCQERYIPIEIVMSRQEGLNIPNSAIVEKRVVKIPNTYLTTGSNTNQMIYFNVRVLDENGNLSISQVAPSIYYKDDSFCYVNPDDFEENAVLVKNDSDETMAISDMGSTKLAGVYNANRGMATFERVEILVSDGDFTIITEGDPYSLKLYDRIVLDGSTVEEGQIIR